MTGEAPKDAFWHPSPIADIARYMAAALVVLAVCLGGTLLMGPRTEAPQASDAVEAVLVDLPPAMAPSSLDQDAAPAPDQPATTAPASQAAAAEPSEAVPQSEPDEPKPALPLEDRSPDAKPPTAVAAAAVAAQEESAPAEVPASAKDAEPNEGEAARAHAALAMTRWQRAMLTRLEKAKRGMTSSGLTGTAIIAFTLDRHGHLLTSTIVRTSGSETLDRTALALLRRATPFSDLPGGLPDQTLSFTIPIAFAHR